MSRKKTPAVADFKHLDRPMDAEMRARFKQACIPGGIQLDPLPKRVLTGTIADFAHLNGPEYAAEVRANAIVAAAALARTPTSAPDATGLAGKIIAAAKRAVKL